MLKKIPNWQKAQETLTNNYHDTEQVTTHHLSAPHTLPEGENSDKFSGMREWLGVRRNSKGGMTKNAPSRSSCRGLSLSLLCPASRKRLCFRWRCFGRPAGGYRHRRLDLGSEHEQARECNSKRLRVWVLVLFLGLLDAQNPWERICRASKYLLLSFPCILCCGLYINEQGQWGVLVYCREL